MQRGRKIDPYSRENPITINGPRQHGRKDGLGT